MSIHNLLLVFSVPATSGRESIVSLLESTRSHLEFQNFSGLYKRYSNNRREDLNAELITVAHATSNLQAFELQNIFQKIEAEKRAHSLTGRIGLLAWDRSISLLPQLTIPHPSLIEDQLILLCAAEACGEFSHPILGKSLRDLLHGVSQSPLAEFVSQPYSVGRGA
jgi:7,8-dihydro-6-hydroxymethylpterin-pyrophosphokinase